MTTKSKYRRRLPSVSSTLAKVTRQVNSTNGNSSGLDNTGYLKLRVSKLSELQRNVLLIIHEIYVASGVYTK